MCGNASPEDAPVALPQVTASAQVDLPAAPHREGRVVTTASGLEYIDEKIGDGPSPASPSSRVTVHYTGWLADGTKFDSSVDRGRPLTLRLTQVIAGWQEGVATMRVGGKRRLVIPPELAYGNKHVGKIPAGSTLTFDIELLSIDDTP